MIPLMERCKKKHKKPTNVSLYVCMSAENSKMLVFLCFFFAPSPYQLALRDPTRNQNVCFFIVFINRGGGVKPIYKKVCTTFVLFCGPPENRPKDDGKPPKTTRKTTETGTNFYKKRPGGGVKGFL